jgi:hypothetical protein
MKRKLDDDVLVLNVGGIKLTTTKTTLVNSKNDFPNSVLATMFSTPSIEMTKKDAKHRYFLDYDGVVFSHVLNVLRDPSLVEEIPHKMNYTSWWKVLGYWGLVDKKEEPELEVVENKPYEMKSLLEVGDAIKKEIMGNEVIVIKAILEKSGYYRSAGKDRSRIIYLPIGGYELPCGHDLGTYVASHQKAVQQLMEQMMGGCCTVKIIKSASKTNIITYLFDEKEYKTSDNHITISLEFSFTL